MWNIEIRESNMTHTYLENFHIVPLYEILSTLLWETIVILQRIMDIENGPIEYWN